MPLPQPLSWHSRYALIQEMVRTLNEKFTDVPETQADEIFFRILKEWRPTFLRLTRVVVEDRNPDTILLARAEKLDKENESLRQQVIGLDSVLRRVDALEVENGLLRRQVEETVPEEDKTELQELIRAAIVRGLGKDNAQMVGQALEYVQELEGKEFLSDLQIEIVPYTIKDTSLEEIILRAPEEIVVKCEAALAKRRANGQADPTQPLTWEHEQMREAVKA